MGRHSKGRHTPPQQHGMVETVEIADTTGTTHLLTVDAAADGLPRSRYTAIRDVDVLPAALRLAITADCALRSQRRGRGVHEIPAGRRLSNLLPPPLVPGGRPDTTAHVALARFQ